MAAESEVGGPGASLPPTWRGLELALADAGMSASRLVDNARQVDWEAAARRAASLEAAAVRRAAREVGAWRASAAARESAGLPRSRP